MISSSKEERENTKLIFFGKILFHRKKKRQLIGIVGKLK
jgi:hypothetical protein